MENSVNERVLQLRQALGLKRTEFAKKCNILQQTVSMVEAGGSKPSYEVLRAMIEHTKVNPLWLMIGEGSMFLEGELADYTPPEKKSNEVFQENNLSIIVQEQKENITRLYSIIDKLIAKGRLFSLGGLSFN